MEGIAFFVPLGYINDFEYSLRFSVDRPQLNVFVAVFAVIYY